jgi:hypothetical protein
VKFFPPFATGFYCVKESKNVEWKKWYLLFCTKLKKQSVILTSPKYTLSTQEPPNIEGMKKFANEHIA